VTAWNERQAKRMPMLFSPTIGAAITAGYWFLRARCPDVDPRALDWQPRRRRDGSHPDCVMSLLPAERTVRRTREPVPSRALPRSVTRAAATDGSASERRDQGGGKRRAARKSVSPYHDAGSFGSGVVSLTISHRKV
jgi:hypothetical protein